MDAKVKITITAFLAVAIEAWVTKDEFDEVQIDSVISARVDHPSVREIEEALDGAGDFGQLDTAYNEATKDTP